MELMVRFMWSGLFELHLFFIIVCYFHGHSQVPCHYGGGDFFKFLIFRTN